MITIDYFSDVLCVWAYGGQVRLDEVRENFRGKVVIRERFTPIFADTQHKVGRGWSDRGGYAGFGEHVREVCRQWPHLDVHPGVWSTCQPCTCTNAHLFLTAAALSLGLDDPQAPSDGRERFHGLIAEVRRAFFERGEDIAELGVLAGLLREGDPTGEQVRDQIDSGRAAAALHRDQELAGTYGVRGSPTYVFNEGRQVLFGNVGYRIIEANLNELLSGRDLEGEPSWC